MNHAACTRGRRPAKGQGSAGKLREGWGTTGSAALLGVSTGLNQRALLPGKFDVGRDTNIPFGDL
jgi:hypothetical protein